MGPDGLVKRFAPVEGYLTFYVKVPDLDEALSRSRTSVTVWSASSPS
jgi:hypothetical protein